MTKSEYEKRSGTIQIGKQLNENVKITDMKELSKLGKGQFGEVTKRLFGNNILAVKEIENKFCGIDKEKICMELEVLLRTIDSSFPNTISFYGYIYDFDIIYIVMETMAMDFKKLYEKYLLPQNMIFPEPVLSKFAVFVLAALRHLSKHNILHRDIKPANIFIDWNGAIKIGDFGVAEKLMSSCASTPASTQSSCGPVVQYNCTLIKDYTADIWSFGLTLFELALCKYPYEKEYAEIQSDHQIDCHVILFYPPTETVPSIYSKDLDDFIKCCMNIQIRPSYIDLMNSPWYQSNRTNDVNLCFWLSHILEKRSSPAIS